MPLIPPQSKRYLHRQINSYPPQSGRACPTNGSDRGSLRDHDLTLLVGSDRDCIVVEADGYWFVGPDNGLFSILVARAKEVHIWSILWRPELLSATFHGRDLFAPIAALIAKGEFPVNKLQVKAGLSVLNSGTDYYAIVYIDHYGNACTGIRMSSISSQCVLEVDEVKINFARFFAEVEAGQYFWYENSIGLVEIAMNMGNAATSLRLSIGQVVAVISA